MSITRNNYISKVNNHNDCYGQTYTVHLFDMQFHTDVHHSLLDSIHIFIDIAITLTINYNNILINIMKILH